MSRRVHVIGLGTAVAVCASLLSMGGVTAQEGNAGRGQANPQYSEEPGSPPSAPVVLPTRNYKVRVTTLVDGLSRPWSLAFLPGGDMLVTERTGQLRIIRNGVLDPQPIAGIPKNDIVVSPRDGLFDVVLHPNFAENHFVYFTYTKRGDLKLAPPDNCGSGADGRSCSAGLWAKLNAPAAQTVVLARGRFDGHALADVRDLFIAQKWVPPTQRPTLGSRIAFGKDGMLYMTLSVSTPARNKAMEPDSHWGKTLRLRDDGTAPPDNPFVGKPGYLPEIFTMGHRNPLGVAVHPETGAIWSSEMGPQGGDEINILLPGRNYGWPKVSMGRDYPGPRFPPNTPGGEFEAPLFFWMPAIGPSGIMFYRGEKFPIWKDSVFVGGLALPHLARVVINKNGDVVGREWMLLELKQRIRDVREGPDGNVYLLTDYSKGALLRMEPAE